MALRTWRLGFTLNDPQTTVKETFLALRLAPILLVAVLGLSVGASISARCILTSISAYYYTASGPAFVAALCAIGQLRHC
jgi:hypothetical protein